jgi:hypothetical protein
MPEAAAAAFWQFGGARVWQGKCGKEGVASATPKQDRMGMPPRVIKSTKSTPSQPRQGLARARKNAGQRLFAVHDGSAAPLSIDAVFGRATDVPCSNGLGRHKTSFRLESNKGRDRRGTTPQCHNALGPWAPHSSSDPSSPSPMAAQSWHGRKQPTRDCRGFFKRLGHMPNPRRAEPFALAGLDVGGGQYANHRHPGRNGGRYT